MELHFSTRQWVAFPAEQVFAFFANPLNLPRLMPPELRTRLDKITLVPPPAPSGPTPAAPGTVAGSGSELWISFTPIPWLPLRQSWRARIVEFVWNSHFIDEQVRGPFRHFRHRHGVTAESREGIAGTVVSDEIACLPGFGFAGQLGLPLLRRSFERSFQARQRRLPELLAQSLNASR
jgi:ligand-binding SRPBCC domain-containing protein